MTGIRWFVLLAVLAVLLGCGRQRDFDAEQWKRVRGEALLEDGRESMVQDLLQSDTLLGKYAPEVTELLGEADIAEAGQFDYVIREQYGSDVDPEYVSFLVVRFGADRRVATYFVEER
ncbi:hypothetical protein LEM8419_00212 [Neolewinella maritima]|uniref:DUF3887 domain-containing protein n=1 Tax=Neolewinella maritima TaxID=1383882 RepID=A0ABM9AWP9_9BACT|nr:hypothetical protein [Neolewinella maritima]CAH0998911.1 hypothetical protein LEM8419_00212 [Neolewinella maritima]